MNPSSRRAAADRSPVADPSARDAGDATLADPASATGGGPAASRTLPAPLAHGRMTPAAALARHVEWLEFALGAARSEEAWRVGRLERASKKNREKRTMRLGEVREEIAELSALVAAIRDLRARKARPARSVAKRPATARPRSRSSERA